MSLTFVPSNSLVLSGLTQAFTETQGSIPSGALLISLQEVSSTMAVAKEIVGGRNPLDFGAVELAGEKAEEGGLRVIAIAHSQTGGRGRYQREWISKPGAGIYGTYLFKPSIAPAELIGVSLAVGCAIRRTLEEFGAKAVLKWPNDVLIEDRSSSEPKKICGVLLELVSGEEGGKRTDFLSVGIGLNLRKQEFPVGVNGISLDEVLDSAADYNAVLCRLTVNLIEVFRAYEQGGFLAFREEWLKNSAMGKKSVSAEFNGRRVSGRVRGVDERGGLIVELEGERKVSIYSGEVLFTDAAGD